MRTSYYVILTSRVCRFYRAWCRTERSFKTCLECDYIFFFFFKTYTLLLYRRRVHFPFLGEEEIHTDSEIRRRLNHTDERTLARPKKRIIPVRRRRHADRVKCLLCDFVFPSPRSGGSQTPYGHIVQFVL